MIEKYYTGDRKLRPHLCYELCPEDPDPNFDFATKDLDRDNIRWAVWSRENETKRTKYVLYRDRKGLVLKKSPG